MGLPADRPVDDRLHVTERQLLDAARYVIECFEKIEGLEPWQEPQIEDEVETISAVEQLANALDDYTAWDGS